MYRGLHVTAIIPALNEEDAIGQVVRCLLALQDPCGMPIVDDVIVGDNGSVDATALRARNAGARVVAEPRRGYGAACQAAIDNAGETDVILFVDGDCSVVVAQAIGLLDAIAEGVGLAIGSRTCGYVEPGAMTWPQQIGNRLVATLISWLWATEVTDLGPFRAIRYRSLQSLAMQDRAYGWTVEMQVKVLQQGLAVREVPVDCRIRLGRSKVSGTVRGVIGAACGMLGMVMRLWWRERRAGTGIVADRRLIPEKTKCLASSSEPMESRGCERQGEV